MRSKEVWPFLTLISERNRNVSFCPFPPCLFSPLWVIPVLIVVCDSWTWLPAWVYYSLIMQISLSSVFLWLKYNFFFCVCVSQRFSCFQLFDSCTIRLIRQSCRNVNMKMKRSIFIGVRSFVVVIFFVYTLWTMEGHLFLICISGCNL